MLGCRRRLGGARCRVRQLLLRATRRLLQARRHLHGRDPSLQLRRRMARAGNDVRDSHVPTVGGMLLYGWDVHVHHRGRLHGLGPDVAGR